MGDEAMTAPLTVEDARARVLAGVEAYGAADCETVPIENGLGRILGAPIATRDWQPPFNSSAMDGWAVRAADVASLPSRLAIAGQAAAGHPFAGEVQAGQAVRIFTGAPVPPGADAIVIQENTTRDDTHVVVTEGRPDPEHVRARGSDYGPGHQIAVAGDRLTPRLMTLLAATGAAHVVVRRRPKVAILATGDELVEPDTTELAPGQIRASNHIGIAAMVVAAGGEARRLGIARDTRASLDAHIAAAADADILVTIGGASVGDHDLVAPALQARGMALDFWKIAMRPGKPLMFGRLGKQRVLGVPGNPVSSLVCARLFLMPLLRALQGLEPEPDRAVTAKAAIPLSANGARAHYMRAITRQSAHGDLLVEPVASQDSSLLTPLARADCLLVRPIGAAAVAAGTRVPIMMLDF
jgi:molybdopterin molybdotransferase